MNFSSPDPLAVSLLIVSLTNVALGCVVIRQSRREQNAVFALTTLFVALWAVTNALFRISVNASTATMWAGLAYVAALGIGAGLLHFSWSFPTYGGSRTGRRVVWSLAAGISAVAFVPGAMIERVDVDTGRIITAPGVYLLALFLPITLGYAFLIFWRSQKRLQGKRRAQARLVLYGSILTAVFGLVFNLVMPLTGNYRFVWAGPCASLFFVGFCTYAIVAARLFDVRLLIRRTFVYSLLLAVLAASFTVLEKGLERVLVPLLGHENSFSGDLIAALLVSFAVDPLKSQLKHIASHRLFQGEDRDD